MPCWQYKNKGLFVCMLLFLWSCSAPKGGEGKACQAPEDCATGLVCLAGSCQFPKNESPIALISSSPEIPRVGQVLNLDGSKSKDPAQQMLTYAWMLRTVPVGSQARLKANEEKASLTPDLPGEYVISLVVSNSNLRSTPATVVISVLQGETVGDRASEEGTIDAGATESEMEPTNPDKVATEEVREASVESGPTDAISIELTTLEPARGPTGGKLRIILRGKDFSQKAQVLLGETLQATTYKNSQELESELDLRTLPPGTYKVKVYQGLTYTQALNFTVTKSIEHTSFRLDILNPWRGTTGSKIPFSVLGGGFRDGAKFFFDAKVLSTTFVNSSELRSTSDLDLTNMTPGTYKLKVLNPDGAESNEQTFTVTAATTPPSIVVLQVGPIFLGEKDKSFALYGRNLKQGAKFFVGTNEIAGAMGSVSWRTSNYIEGVIDASDLSKWKPGAIDVYVQNLDGQKSNTVKISILYQTPNISRISPQGWTGKCTTKTTVTVFGSGFYSSSQLHFGNQIYKKGDPTYPLTFVDSTRLSFPFDTNNPPSKFASGGYEIFIRNAVNAESKSIVFSYDSFASNEPVPIPELGYFDPIVGAADSLVTLRFHPGPNSRSIKIGAVVTLDGKPQPTTCAFSLTYCRFLDVTLDLHSVKLGEYDLRVVNPCDRKSLPTLFSIESPRTPYISGFQPAFSRVGEKTKITIWGKFFQKNHQLLWAGKVIPSTFKSSTEIQTTGLVDFSNSTGVLEFQVKNANGKSTDLTKFSVLGPGSTPTITAAIHNVRSTASTPLLPPLAIQGSGFTAQTQVLIDGKLIGATKYLSPTALSLYGLSNTNTSAGIHSIITRNGNQHSNSYPLVVLTPTLRIDYISPANVIFGATKKSISISGS